MPAKMSKSVRVTKKGRPSGRRSGVRYLSDRVRENFKYLFGPARPGEVRNDGFFNYSANENDGGRWARCSVCGDLSRCRTEQAAWEAEQAHWNTKHV